MTENNPSPVPAANPAASDEPKPSRLHAFRTNHPRVSRAIALTGAGLGIVVVTSAAKNMQANKAKLVEAKEHAAAGLDALSDSVATPDTEA